MADTLTPATDALETRDLWNRLAADWDREVGDDGDFNRVINSDPVLWRFAGDVSGRVVLDAGCGTGYLSRKLHARGARVVGVDLSEGMLAVARARGPGVDFRQGSCSDLAPVESGSIDLIVSNYVLMDTPDLDGALRSFHRVLKPGGAAALVFSHPCFPQGPSRAALDRAGMQYRWPLPYFEPRKCVDPPWGRFTSDFIWFHRPLSDYWRAFVAAGFAVEEFEEPRPAEGDLAALGDPALVEACRHRPYSVAFKLGKPAGR